MPESIFNMEQQSEAVWLIAEQDRGNLDRVSLELLRKGSELAKGVGWPLIVLLMGSGVGDAARCIAAHGADQVLLADHPGLTNFSVEAYTHVAATIIQEYRPSVLLIGATPNGRDLAGRLAVRLRTGLNADCSSLLLPPQSGVLICEVSGFGGGVLAQIEMRTHRPQMATVRPGVFLPAEPFPDHFGEITHVPVHIDENVIQTKLIKQFRGEELDLTKAPVLLAGGRGVDGRFDLLRALADRLGGEVGATRPAVDDGYIGREHQIGQTGVVCRPKVAIICGISGAFHFVVGILEAETIIAINSDPNAPIFEFADYCIVGDVHQILPRLLEALNAEIPPERPMNAKDGQLIEVTEIG